jgi:putative heme iron utilization protein
LQPELAQRLRQLLLAQDIAALGTLHKGEPAVSMVPYALLPGSGKLVIHVSQLATHTRDMHDHPGVSMLVLGERMPQMLPQELPRATLQGEARPCPPEDDDHAAARQAYLARFPHSEEMFGFADFSLFVIVPNSVRFVGGFAQAGSIVGEDYARLMAPS